MRYAVTFYQFLIEKNIYTVLYIWLENYSRLYCNDELVYFVCRKLASVLYIYIYTTV